MNILEPVPRESTIWLENDKPKNMSAGRLNNINLIKRIVLCSRGKRIANIRNAAGIIPDVAKPILPQNNSEG